MVIKSLKLRGKDDYRWRFDKLRCGFFSVIIYQPLVVHVCQLPNFAIAGIMYHSIVISLYNMLKISENWQWTIHEKHLLLDAVREFCRGQPRGPVSWEAVYQTYQNRGGLVHGCDKLIARFRRFKKSHRDGPWNTEKYGDSNTIFPPVVPLVQVPIQTIPLPNQFQSPPNYPPNYLDAFLSGPGSSSAAYLSGPLAAYLSDPGSSSVPRLRSQPMVRRRPLVVSQ